MYATYIVRRTQIYLEEAQALELARRSDARGVTLSHMIREAISAYLTEGDDDGSELARQRASLNEAFGAVPRLPGGARYVDELRQNDRAREERLKGRWRSG
jgi:hypothetical protein